MMSIRQILIVLTAIVLILLVAGYLEFRSPHDLEIASVRVITWASVPLRDEPGGAAEPKKLLLDVEFRTSRDLASFAHSFVYQGLYVHAWDCDTGVRISEGFNLVYDRLGRISFGRRSRLPDKEENYHVYISLQSSNIPGFSNYDLTRQPTNVCFALVPDMPDWGFGPPTNTLRVEKSQIAKLVLGQAK